MKQDDIISVIIPVYNTKNYLNKCIDSVLRQTYKNIEIIIIDDGSTDGSAELCDMYAKKDKRIKVLHKENSGVSDARNHGLKIAKGKYIGFVDSDDYIEETMYEYLYNLIKKNNADMSICNVFLVEGKSIREQNTNKGVEIKQLNKLQVLDEILLDRNIQSYSCNKLFKKELFKDVKYPSGKKYEDIQTIFYLLENCENVVISDLPQYYYVKRDESIVNKVSEKTILDYIEIIENRYEYVKTKYKELYKNNIYYYTKTLITAYKDAYYLKNVSETLRQKLEIYYNKVKKIISENEKYVIDIYTSKQKMEIFTLLYDIKLYYYYLERYSKNG